jgi:hypothetical protein
MQLPGGYNVTLRRCPHTSHRMLETHGIQLHIHRLSPHRGHLGGKRFMRSDLPTWTGQKHPPVPNGSDGADAPDGWLEEGDASQINRDRGEHFHPFARARSINVSSNKRPRPWPQ